MNQQANRIKQTILNVQTFFIIFIICGSVTHRRLYGKSMTDYINIDVMIWRERIEGLFHTRKNDIISKRHKIL